MAVQTATTFAEAFMTTVDRRAEDVALRTKDDEVTITWGQWRDRSAAIAAGLQQLGLEHGQCVGILLGNRPEFHLVDIGVLIAGGTPFSIYQTSSPEQLQYLVSDADARILITEPMFLPLVQGAREELPNLEHVVVVDPEGELPDGCLSLADLEERGAGADFDLQAALDAIEPEDILTLIYTSGTTGPPKGVQLSHRNLLAAVDAIEAMVQFDDDSRVISWLPSAHIAERAAHHYLPIRYGIQVTSCPDPKQVVSYLPAVQPTWFFAVPRVWEKLKAGLEAMLAAQPEEKQQAMKAAIEASTQKVRLEQAGEPVPDELAAAVAKADEQAFAGIRQMLGFSSIKAVNVGAAPTPVEVIEFFHAIGVPVAEIWGMSETCGAGAANRPGRIKIGTVGEPAPGFEIKLAEDGEVLVRADAVMTGYRNLPDKTAETIDVDGWLHTGDIGEFDEDGYLKIVDRKKELIINAAGKNMSPSFIEATLKSSSPLIGQACVIGDARSYNTALIVLDADFAPMWAQQQGIEDASLESLARDDRARAAVQEAVDAANAKLSRVEQIKKFTIVEGDWLPGGDELTPTMKLKRKPIGAKYDDAISAMYA
ncbi:MAG: long-chain fatty acid--CoA ligase [Solirubrobacteraceae bacterium]|nr:long-chain fatty acid--CoA ligase [Solirubrobacteraceae bacterium]